MSALEDKYDRIAESLKETTAKVGNLESTQTQNHNDNRRSIHDIRGSQDTIMGQNVAAQADITILKTKMDAVVGTDHGKPGKLDEIVLGLKELNDSRWLTKILETVVVGGAAALAAHFAK